MDSTSNLGYSYYMPTGGFLRLKSLCTSNYCDIFGVFNRYLAPAYHHDRCERSVQMKLYTLHKREFVMIFLGFFIALGIVSFIGVVGPPITWTTEKLATSLPNITDKNIETGPYAVLSPELGAYHQQLWFMAKIDTKSHEGETFEKPFTMSVDLYANLKESLETSGSGSSKDVQPLKLFEAPTQRERRLVCPAGACEPVNLLHLGYIDYPKYLIILKFSGLESVHENYHIREIHFYFKTYNPSFTQLEITFRFFYSFMTFAVTCWFMYSLRRYVMSDWSIEQKWMTILLALLFLYNNPTFPMMFFMNSTFPGMLDAIFQITFLSALFLFWLSIYHGLRQVERRLLTFYLPKIILVGSLWMSAIILACWQKSHLRRDPTYNYEQDTVSYDNLKLFFMICGIAYLLDLIYLMFKAYSELRSMPYFDRRLRFLTGLMLLVMKISMIITYMRFGINILEDHFVADLATKYSSSIEFMSFYGLLNLYIFTMVFVYSPSSSATLQSASSNITKDNPSFSMVNDSDEDVIYGSEEDETKTPLNLNNGQVQQQQQSKQQQLLQGQHHDDSD